MKGGIHQNMNPDTLHLWLISLFLFGLCERFDKYIMLDDNFIIFFQNALRTPTELFVDN
jgi:hypothetical protein